MLRGASTVTVRGFTFRVGWHYFQDPGNWVEDTITIEDPDGVTNDELTLDAERWQDLLKPELYEEVMDAVDKKVIKGPAG
jgi:hypothetical protein